MENLQARYHVILSFTSFFAIDSNCKGSLVGLSDSEAPRVRVNAQSVGPLSPDVADSTHPACNLYLS